MMMAPTGRSAMATAASNLSANNSGHKATAIAIKNAALLVSESGLKPNQTVAVFAGEGIIIRSNGLSRTVFHLVRDSAKKWGEAEKERATRDSSDPEFIEMDSGKIKAFLAEKDLLEWNPFKRLGGKLSHFQCKVVNEVKRHAALHLLQDPNPTVMHSLTNKPAKS